MSTIPYELDLRIVEMIRSDRVDFPPYPAVALRLNNALLGSGEHSAADLEEIISADQVLAASVLRYVNSPARRAASPINSLRSAIARLGDRELLGLALAVGLGQTLLQEQSGLVPLKRMVWRNALFCAEVSRQLAGRWGLADDVAFACGLLHDFGKMIAIACLEQILGGRDQPVSGARCIEVVETYHVELGTVVAERWNLPDAVAEVAACHHDPNLATRHRPLVDLMEAADQVVALMETLHRVTEQDLEQVPALGRPADRTFVANLLLVLPLVVQAFEGSAERPQVPRRRRPTMLERPRTTLETARAPWLVDFPASVVTLSGPVSCRATYLSERGIGLRTPMCLQEQALIQLVLQAPSGDIELWAAITLCVEEAPGFRVEVQPLGLKHETNQQWLKLISDLQQTP